MDIISEMPKNDVINHLKKFARWIWHAPEPIYGFLIIIEALIYCLFLTNNIQNIIICGLLMQLFGILTALHVLWKLQNDFGQSFQKPFSTWWSLRPLRKFSPIYANGNLHAKEPRINGRSSSWMPNHQSGPPEERLDKISYNIENLRTSDIALFERVFLIERSQEDTSQILVNSIEETKKEFREQLKKSFTEDIHYSMTGLLLLLVGVVISTVASIINYN